MVFNTSFNNISAIWWWSVLLTEGTGVPEENHRPVASHWQTWSHNVVWSTPRHERDSNSQLKWWYALPWDQDHDNVLLVSKQYKFI